LITIGLTGPIGCGKSTIAGWLGAHGVSVIDADAVARDVSEAGTPTFDEIVDRFGRAVLTADGSLDRAALGRIVFSDEPALRDLESIVHPAVRESILATLRANEAAGVEVTAIEAIKLVEGGLAAICDEVWLIVCDPRVQRQRVQRRIASAAEADQRIAAQHGIVDRLRPAATRIIDTSAGRAETKRVVADALDAALGSRPAATGT
jgi:dephospho-CoA kinase